MLNKVMYCLVTNLSLNVFAISVDDNHNNRRSLEKLHLLDNGILSCDYIAREKETIQGEENPCGGTFSSSLTMSSFMVSIIINSVIYRR